MGCGDSKPAPAPGLRVDLGTGPVAPQHVSFKVVMMGDKSTGKSSIVLRYTKGTFTGATQATIGASFASNDVRCVWGGGYGECHCAGAASLGPASPRRTSDGTTVRLQLWDTAGEEMYRAMTRSFFRDAAAGECWACAPAHVDAAALATAPCLLPAGIIVYDITSTASFKNVKTWLREFKVRPLDLEFLFPPIETPRTHM